MTTEQELIDALAEEFPNVDSDALTATSVLRDELGLSSLDVLIVRAKIEDAFGVKVSDADIITSVTIADLVLRINAMRHADS